MRANRNVTRREVFRSDDRPGSLHFGIQYSADSLSCFFFCAKGGGENGDGGGKVQGPALAEEGGRWFQMKRTTSGYLYHPHGPSVTYQLFSAIRASLTPGVSCPGVCRRALCRGGDGRSEWLLLAAT